VDRTGIRQLPPSGEQFEISLGDQRATIVEVGGGVRSYTVADRPVLESFDVDRMCDGAHGAVLIPWPNRVEGGRYRFDGVDHQLDLSEPEKTNAIHGLLRWRPWRCEERDRSRVHMATRLHPVPGYPFALDVEVAYELRADGLVVRSTATNIGDVACPYGCGHHPYLSPGEGMIDDGSIRLTAATRIIANGEPHVPAGRAPVDDTPFDLRSGRAVGGMRLDDAFTDLERDERGRAHVLFRGTDGVAVDLWADGSYRFIQLYTGDTLAPDRRRRGLAAEPMTCAPDAFNSGDGLVRLEPGESFTAEWGVGLR
jgi:aldose 1-epimerase